MSRIVDNYLQKLVGKTIRSISEPHRLSFSGTSSEYEDDNIVIVFEDMTILKLASWDSEAYCSGITREILEIK